MVEAEGDHRRGPRVASGRRLRDFRRILDGELHVRSAGPEDARVVQQNFGPNVNLFVDNFQTLLGWIATYSDERGLYHVGLVFEG